MEINEIKKNIYDYVKKVIQDRLEKIEVDKEMYAIEEWNNSNDDISLRLLYGKHLYINFIPFISFHYNPETGNFLCSTERTIKYISDTKWYNHEYRTIRCCVTQDFTWIAENNNYSSNEFLDIFLPTSKTDVVNRISKELNDIGVNDASIKFDTINQRYNIYFDLLKYLQGEVQDGQNQKPITLYKYMSLQTFMCMLKNKKIRMNSIVSMNDTSESFFLGDILCNAFDDIKRKITDPEFYESYPDEYKNQKIIEYKNNLIFCLTSLHDDPLMWKLYGDQGKGICVGFKCPLNKVRRIIYLSEKDEKLVKLRKLFMNFEKDSVYLNYPDIEKYKFITKSSQFEYESEYRYIEYCENPDFTSYGNLISFYNDYEINKFPLSLSSVHIGANMANKELNYPLLVDLIKTNLGSSVSVFKSKVDKFRV